MIKITKKEEYEDGKIKKIEFTVNILGCTRYLNLKEVVALKIELDKALAQEQ